MIGVSARSYVAAGLATAVAGVALASPVLAQSQVRPSVSSSSVELSAFGSEAERAAERGISDAAVGVMAATNVVAQAAESAAQGKATAAAGLKSNPLMQAAAVTVVANAVQAVADSKQNYVSNAAAVQSDSVTSPAVAPSHAVTAAFPGLPGLNRIVAIPLLLADIPVVLTSEALFSLGQNTGFGLRNVLEGFAFGDMDEVKRGFQQIGNTIPDFLNRANTDIVQLTRRVQQVFSVDTGVGNGDAVASAIKAFDAKSQGTVNSAKSADSIKADDSTKTAGAAKTAGATKAGHSTKVADNTSAADDANVGTVPTSKPSTGGHENAPSSVNGTVKNSGATKSQNTARNGAASGMMSHGGNASTSGTSVSGARGSVTKHAASAGDSGSKHPAAGAKKGGDGAGGSKGGKGGK